MSKLHLPVYGNQTELTEMYDERLMMENELSSFSFYAWVCLPILVFSLWRIKNNQICFRRKIVRKGIVHCCIERISAKKFSLNSDYIIWVFIHSWTQNSMNWRKLLKSRNKIQLIHLSSPFCITVYSVWTFIYTPYADVTFHLRDEDKWQLQMKIQNLSNFIIQTTTSVLFGISFQSLVSTLSFLICFRIS